MSAPAGDSINEYIKPLDYSLQYATIDNAIAICSKLGKRALMAKVDFKNAFRLCPVKPEDWHLLDIYWHDNFYMDKCLPFGLRSAPFLFNMRADDLHWILLHYFGRTSNLFHYLDVFFS